MILPDHADVANAIGAVVGRITMRRRGTVTAPSEGRYRIHHTHAPEDFTDQAAAQTRLEGVLTAEATAAAKAAGAEDLRIRVSSQVKTAQTEGREIFVEAEVTVEASGRPAIVARKGPDEG